MSERWRTRLRSLILSLYLFTNYVNPRQLVAALTFGLRRHFRSSNTGPLTDIAHPQELKHEDPLRHPCPLSGFYFPTHTSVCDGLIVVRLFSFWDVFFPPSTLFPHRSKTSSSLYKSLQHPCQRGERRGRALAETSK